MSFGISHRQISASPQGIFSPKVGVLGKKRREIGRKMRFPALEFPNLPRKGGKRGRFSSPLLFSRGFHGQREGKRDEKRDKPLSQPRNSKIPETNAFPAPESQILGAGGRNQVGFSSLPPLSNTFYGKIEANRGESRDGPLSRPRNSGIGG